MPITDAQREVLAKQDDQTLAEWYCELNSWRWPKDLPDEESPPAFARQFNDGKDIRWSVMTYIQARVGERLISRTWNKEMTDAEFESFRQGERGPGTPYGEYVDRRIASRTAAMEARANRIIASDVVLEDILDAEYISED